MYKQQIEKKTFIGTSDPVTLYHGLSYYGPNAPDSSDLAIERFYYLIDDYVDSHVGQSCRIKLSANITAGLVLPSWAASITVEEGEITSDTMQLTIADNTLMGGMVLGALVQLHFQFDYRFWQNGHWDWKGWHSGHWQDWHSFKHQLNFDVIPIGVDFIVGLVGLVPKFKVLFQILPKGLLDHMQDSVKNGIVDEYGLFINASIPMKWDLISLGRAIAGTGLEVASLGLTPAVAAVVTALVELAELAVSLLDKLKVVQIAFGPQIDFVFPVRVRITKLVAGYEAEPEAFVYDQLTFAGNTITAHNSSDRKIAEDSPVPVERIGLHFEHSLELPTNDVGAWCHFGLFWIFGASPSWDLHLTQIIERELDFDLGVKSFTSSMSNGIGQSGELGPHGDRPESIQVRFV